MWESHVTADSTVPQCPPFRWVVIKPGCPHTLSPSAPAGPELKKREVSTSRCPGLPSLQSWQPKETSLLVNDPYPVLDSNRMHTKSHPFYRKEDRGTDLRRSLPFSSRVTELESGRGRVCSPGGSGLLALPFSRVPSLLLPCAPSWSSGLLYSLKFPLPRSVLQPGSLRIP